MIETWLPVLAAPFIGSFCGVLIIRMPEGRSVTWARSRCDACGHVLGPGDLLPLVSFLLRRGRCGHCGARIAAFHVLVELAAVAISVWACVAAADARSAWTDSVLGWTLLTLAWIDWRTMLLPNGLTLPLLLAGLANVALWAPEDLTDHALAALVGYGGIALLAWAYQRIRGRDGIGLGDAKLLAAGGAWVGLAALPWVLAFAACLGIVFGLTTRTYRDGTCQAARIPFGPPLAIAIWIFR